MKTNRPDSHLRRTLREIALVLGGVLHTHDADDELAACIGRCLAETYRDALRDVGAPVAKPGLHPDIAALVDLASGTGTDAPVRAGWRAGR